MSHSTDGKSLRGFRTSLIRRVRHAEQVINDPKRRVRNYRAEAERHASLMALNLLDEYLERE